MLARLMLLTPLHSTNYYCGRYWTMSQNADAKFAWNSARKVSRIADFDPQLFEARPRLLYLLPLAALPARDSCKPKFTPENQAMDCDVRFRALHSAAGLAVPERKTRGVRHGL